MMRLAAGVLILLIAFEDGTKALESTQDQYR
jgi:hypothetical protein